MLSKYWFLVSLFALPLFGINLPDEIKSPRNTELFKKIEKSAAMIKIEYRRDDGAIVEVTGSGVLVDTQTLMTAAHLFQAGGYSLSVEIQGHRFAAELGQVEVTADVKKRHFDIITGDDVALVRLARPIPASLLASGLIKPMPIVSKENYDMNEKEVYFAGFGSVLEDRSKDEHVEVALEKMQLKKYVAFASSEPKYADDGLAWVVGTQLGHSRPLGRSGLPSGGDSGGPLVRVVDGEPYLMGTLSGSSHQNGWFDWMSAPYYLKVEATTEFRVAAEPLGEKVEVLPAPAAIPSQPAADSCRNPLATWFSATWGESSIYYGYGDTEAAASQDSLDYARESALRPYNYGTKTTRCACISAAYNPTTGDYFFTTGDTLDGLSAQARAACDATRGQREGGCTYITGRCRSANDGWTIIGDRSTSRYSGGYSRSTSSGGSYSYSYSRSYSSSGSGTTPPPRPGFLGRRLRK